MIIDNQEYLEKYSSLNEYFKNLDDYLKHTDLTNLSAGTYKICDDDLYLIISESKPDENPVIITEAHRKYIDCQIAVEGEFQLGWKALKDCTKIKTEYSEEKEAIFFDDEPEMFVDMKPGMFSLLFPQDVHTIYPNNEYLKRAIFKILV
jgi:biofilm protein TabA